MPNVLASPLRVLVVDDCPDPTTSIALLLQFWGHDVRVANDGLSAVALGERYRPNVVLLDITMPGMDGYEVARRLRQQPELAHASLFSLSGYAQERDRRRSFEAGCDGHLLKPVDPDLLRRLLDSVQEGVGAGRVSAQPLISTIRALSLSHLPYLP